MLIRKRLQDNYLSLAENILYNDVDDVLLVFHPHQDIALQERLDNNGKSTSVISYWFNTHTWDTAHTLDQFMWCHMWIQMYGS